MTHLDRGHYASKHPDDRKPDPTLVEAVRSHAKDGTVACTTAFEIARDHGVTPAEVGFTIDTLEIRIVRCQLGLFGYGSKKTSIPSVPDVKPELEEAIRQALKEGRLPCAAAWSIANRFGLEKPRVTGACDTLGIKINRCQLGSF